MHEFSRGFDSGENQPRQKIADALTDIYQACADVANEDKRAYDVLAQLRDLHASSYAKTEINEAVPNQWQVGFTTAMEHYKSTMEFFGLTTDRYGVQSFALDERRCPLQITDADCFAESLSTLQEGDLPSEAVSMVDKVASKAYSGVTGDLLRAYGVGQAVDKRGMPPAQWFAYLQHTTRQFGGDSEALLMNAAQIADNIRCIGGDEQVATGFQHLACCAEEDTLGEMAKLKGLELLDNNWLHTICRFGDAAADTGITILKELPNDSYLTTTIVRSLETDSIEYIFKVREALIDHGVQDIDISSYLQHLEILRKDCLFRLTGREDTNPMVEEFIRQSLDNSGSAPLEVEKFDKALGLVGYLRLRQWGHATLDLALSKEVVVDGTKIPLNGFRKFQSQWRSSEFDLAYARVGSQLQAAGMEVVEEQGIKRVCVRDGAEFARALAECPDNIFSQDNEIFALAIHRLYEYVHDKVETAGLVDDDNGQKLTRATTDGEEIASQWQRCGVSEQQIKQWQLLCYALEEKAENALCEVNVFANRITEEPEPVITALQHIRDTNPQSKFITIAKDYLCTELQKKIESTQRLVLSPIDVTVFNWSTEEVKSVKAKVLEQLRRELWQYELTMQTVRDV